MEATLDDPLLPSSSWRSANAFLLLAGNVEKGFASRRLIPKQELRRYATIKREFVGLRKKQKSKLFQSYMPHRKHTSHRLETQIGEKIRRHCLYFEQSLIDARAWRKLRPKRRSRAKEGALGERAQTHYNRRLRFAVTGSCVFRRRPMNCTFRCVNAASHATWNLKIDLEKSTADGFPAKINAASVTWRDATHGGS